MKKVRLRFDWDTKVRSTKTGHRIADGLRQPVQTRTRPWMTPLELLNRWRARRCF